MQITGTEKISYFEFITSSLSDFLHAVAIKANPVSAMLKIVLDKVIVTFCR